MKEKGEIYPINDFELDALRRELGISANEQQHTSYRQQTQNIQGFNPNGCTKENGKR